MNAASAPRPGPLLIENGIVLFCSPEAREVSAPEGVTGIAPDAFAESRVQTVFLPASVKWIGARA